jgi:hypothetical protein
MTDHTDPRVTQAREALIASIDKYGDSWQGSGQQGQAWTNTIAALDAYVEAVQVEAAQMETQRIAAALSDAQQQEPTFDQRAKWFRDGRRSAFTSILSAISESSPDLVPICPCENPNCSEPVHRNGRVKPSPPSALKDEP